MRKLALVMAFALAVACARKREAAAYRNAPVILISIDTLRSDHLPAYGYRGVATPHLDALRAESTLFERAYSHCPMTLPSHLSILTGLLPTEHGVRNNIGYRFERGKHRTLAAAFRAAGYRTGAAVSSYVLRSDTGVDDGFEFYDDTIPVAAAGAVSEHQRSGFETLKVAERWIGEHAREPFFFFFHIYEPHAPYAPPAPFASQADDRYDGEIATADAIVGQLLDHLRATGVYDDAIIVLLSDHGEGLMQHGEDQHGILLYREALQVPLMLKLPHAKRGAASVSRPVALTDVFPTLLALVGVDAHDAPLLRADAPPRAIYSETLYPRIHLGWSELRSLIDGSHHLIDGPRPELYDVVADPAEQRDRIGDDRRVASSLRAKLQKFPSTIESLQTIDPEEAAKLAALGYVGTPKNRTGPLPNPRDEIGHLAEIKEGFALADAGRYDDAVVVFRKLLVRNPHLNDVWSKLGEILVASGRNDEAIEAYKAAQAQSERFSPDLALGLAYAYLKAERPNDAIAHAQLALSMNPREANELLARAYSDLRQFDEAERRARGAIDLGDRQPTSLLLLAEVQRNEGRLPEALATANDAERRANDLEVPHLYGLDYLRGDILARLDRPDDAIAAYHREIAASPQHLQSYANLAVIFMIEGKSAEADRVLEQMAARNPHRGAYLLAAKTLEAFGDRAGAARWRKRAA